MAATPSALTKTFLLLRSLKRETLWIRLELVDDGRPVSDGGFSLGAQNLQVEMSQPWGSGVKENHDLLLIRYGIPS